MSRSRKMELKETNQFNNVFIPPFRAKHKAWVYPREEIADPRKLLALILHGKSWDVFEYDNSILYRTWFPWRKTWGTVKSIGVYAATEHPSMFDHMFSLVLDPQVPQICAWLRKWSETLFVVSSPLLSDDVDGYFVRNRYPVHTVPLNATEDAFTTMLGNEAFTICNGMTLFLAMIRLRQLRPRTAFVALSKFIHDYPPNPQTIPDSWMALFLNHTTPHVAHFPWHYSQMGCDPVPFHIAALLCKPEDMTLLIPQVGNLHIGSITSYNAMILHTRPDASVAAGWPSIPPDLDDEDTFTPDFASFVVGVVKTRRMWRWWCNYGRFHVFQKARDSRNIMTAWLVPILSLYSNAKVNGLCHSRLRTMWMQVLDFYDPKRSKLGYILVRWIVAEKIMEHLQARLEIRGPLEVPFSFIKDAFETYKEKIGLFHKHMFRCFTSHISAMTKAFSDGKVKDNCIIIGRNLFQLMKEAPENNVWRVFYDAYISKRITSRLLGIKIGFGLDGGAPIPHSLAPADTLYVVGSVLQEYVRDKKEYLVF